MAIYHLTAKVISRSAGRSAVAAAAYRSGERLKDAREGKTHDYSRREDVEHSEIMAPETAPEWMRDREQLWNGVEAAERRSDAQLSREVEFALPRELSRAEQIETTRAFVQREFVDRGMVADIAIHAPAGADGQEQPHAHVMLTMRSLTGAGFGPKTQEWNGKDTLENWRSAWADHANRALERAGHSARIDHRSYEAQGIDREPTQHLGPTAVRLTREGKRSDRAAANDDIRVSNRVRELWRERLETVKRELADLARQAFGRDQAKDQAPAKRDQVKGGPEWMQLPPGQLREVKRLLSGWNRHQTAQERHTATEARISDLYRELGETSRAEASECHRWDDLRRALGDSFKNPDKALDRIRQEAAQGRPWGAIAHDLRAQPGRYGRVEGGMGARLMGRKPEALDAAARALFGLRSVEQRQTGLARRDDLERQITEAKAERDGIVGRSAYPRNLRAELVKAAKGLSKDDFGRLSAQEKAGLQAARAAAQKAAQRQQVAKQKQAQRGGGRGR